MSKPILTLFNKRSKAASCETIIVNHSDRFARILFWRPCSTWRGGLRFLASLLFFIAVGSSLIGDAPPQAEAFPDFTPLKYGVFVHYVWGGDKARMTIDKEGNVPRTFDDLAAAFDANAFADDLSSWGVEYVIFTAWHANLNPLFPSETMKKWGLASHYCQRDLIGDMIKAVKAKGIKVILYTHPRDGYMDVDELNSTGWGSGPDADGTDPKLTKFDRKKWNDFTVDLYSELLSRYGKEIVGLYLDEGSGKGDSDKVVDYPRLREIIKKNNPNLIMIQNFYGNLYSCDIGDEEYSYWREFGSNDGDQWPANHMPVGTVFAGNWWAGKDTPYGGVNAAHFTPECMFRYTVLQAGTNTDGGGVQWAAGVYAGGGWEPKVYDTMKKVGSLIEPIAESIKGVLASKIFPTPSGATIKNLSWGVATSSVDGSSEYIHVLKSPSGKTLDLPSPSNNVHFSSAERMPTNELVLINQDDKGVHLTLPDNQTWADLDTVIKLKVSR